MDQTKKLELYDEFRASINRLNIEGESDVPDFLLAQMAVDVVESVCEMVKKRDKWFTIDPWAIVHSRAITKPDLQQQQEKTA